MDEEKGRGERRKSRGDEWMKGRGEERGGKAEEMSG